ncbi:MAG: TraG/TraD/VirD4 family protein [Chloroflexota bacterium]|nr:TraG/TraD/VirD4 family protein [Chloroflexota bacterium]
MIDGWAAATPAERAKATPVLCLVDEAARTPIPAIPEYMATVAGYGISVWVAVHSLAQLRDELWACSSSDDPRQRRRSRLLSPAGPGDGRGALPPHGPDAGSGPPQLPQPLLLPHEVLQLNAEHVVAFAGGTPPARLERRLAKRSAVARARPPAGAVSANYPRDDAGRLAAAAGAARNLDKYVERAEPGRLMTRYGRGALVALLLAVAFVGVLWLVDRIQTETQQRNTEERQQQQLAVMTATTRAFEATMLGVHATQIAAAVPEQMTVEAEASRSVATLGAYRANLDATMTAVQVSAQATNTALAKR